MVIEMDSTKTEDQDRAAFEAAAYRHFQRRLAAGKIPAEEPGDGTPEALFWRDEKGDYGVKMFNAAWWGFKEGRKV